MLDRTPLADELQELHAKYLSKGRKIVRAAVGEARKGNTEAVAVLQAAAPDLMSASAIAFGKSRKLPLLGLASFRRSLSMRHRASTLVPGAREWAINGKLRGFSFVDRLGIQRPRVLASGKLADIRSAGLTRAVIKPADGAGSANVFVMSSPAQVHDLTAKTMITLDEVFALLETKIAARKAADRWLAEELIAENEEGAPGRDLKFYCFYGKCGLVLEIVRKPENRYCFWLPDGSHTETGKYEGKLFMGDGVSPDQVALAESLSAKIPVPFLRLDFLRSHLHPQEMVFGEFTPSPGNYEEFGDETDTRLGEMFLAAELRLHDDLLAGKTFPEFTQSKVRSA